MNLARKLAAGAIAAGLTTASVLATTTPAGATVVNSTCNLSSVVRIYYGGGSYCYVWDGKSPNFGWMSIKGAYKLTPDSYEGSVRDNQGKLHPFQRGVPVQLGDLWLTGIFFTGN
ncbi:hypothetical protein AB0L41_46320 [Amycolatopsis mediterranei]|uniref:hypothetical protein n=1 Tax=Amycolatopsis mediterranei TaxID=33910 RepID=UPI00341266E3